jgi:hypothetical protein
MDQVPECCGVERVLLLTMPLDPTAIFKLLIFPLIAELKHKMRVLAAGKGFGTKKETGDLSRKGRPSDVGSPGVHKGDKKVDACDPTYLDRLYSQLSTLQSYLVQAVDRAVKLVERTVPARPINNREASKGSVKFVKVVLAPRFCMLAMPLMVAHRPWPACTHLSPGAHQPIMPSRSPMQVKDWGSGEPADLGQLELASGTASDVLSTEESPFHQQLARRLEAIEAGGGVGGVASPGPAAAPLPPFERWALREEHYRQYLADLLCVHVALEQAVACCAAVLAEQGGSGAAGIAAGAAAGRLTRCVRLLGSETGLQRSVQIAADVEGMRGGEGREAEPKASANAAAYGAYLSTLGQRAVGEDRELQPMVCRWGHYGGIGVASAASAPAPAPAPAPAANRLCLERGEGGSGM